MSHTQYHLQSWTNFIHKESHNILVPWVSLEELVCAEQRLENFYRAFCKPAQRKTTTPIKQYAIFKKLINVTKRYIENDLHDAEDLLEHSFLNFLSDNYKVLRKESIGIAFVDKQKGNSGITGTLNLTIVDNNKQLMFSCPKHNRFLITDDIFRQSIEKVKQFALQSKLWNKNYSICWSIYRDDNKPLDDIHGASLGGAFAIATMKLLTQNQNYCLDKIVCSATFSEDGELSTVDYINDKIKSANNNYYSTIIISSQQAFHLDDNHTKNINIVRVKNIDEAREEIIRYQDSRRHLLKEIETNCETIRLFDGVELQMATNYQNIPILQEIKAHRLPKQDLHSQASHSKWERTEKNKDTQTQKLDINKDILFSKDPTPPRLIVTGAPGSGKSTMVRNIVWTLAKKALKNSYDKIPVKIKLSDWEKSEEKNLEVFLYHHYSHNVQNIDSKQWDFWLRRGDIFLLLDGLDEVANPQFLDTHIKPTLIRKYPHCPVIITCRTISFRQYQGLASSMQVYAVSELNNEMRNDYIKKFPELKKYEKKLTSQLATNKAMSAISRNPLLLSMICYLATKDIKLPKKRSEFYKKMLNNLFENLGSTNTQAVENNIALSSTKKIMILADAIWKIIYNSDIPQRFDEEDLIISLEKSLQQHNISDSGRESSRMLREFIGKCGVLRKDEQKYYFQHLSIQEYLIAKAIANDFNNSNKNKNTLTKLKNNMQRSHWHCPTLFVLEMTTNANVLFELLKDISRFYFIYPNWEDSVSIAATTLKQKSPKLFYRLLNKIIAKKNQDLFYNQLFFAATIIGVTKSYNYKKRNYIIKKLRKLIPIYYYTKKVCDAYVDLQAKEYLQDIVPLLDHEGWDYREKACKTIGILGNRDYIPYLRELIEDRYSADAALDAIFKWANEDDLQWMDELLLQPKSSMLSPMENKIDYELVDKFVKFVKENHIQKILPRLLSSDDRSVQYRALNILSKLKNKSYIKYLEPYFENPCDNIREICCQTIRSLEDSSYLNYIKRYLDDPCANIRTIACYTVMELGENKDLDSVLHCRYDTNFFTVSAFCKYIGKLGTSKDVEKLMDIIRNRDKVAIELLQKHSKQELTLETIEKLRFRRIKYDDVLNETGVALAEDFFKDYLLGETICEAMINVATHEHVDLVFEILEYFDDIHMTGKAAELFAKIAKQEDWQKLKNLQYEKSPCLRSFAYSAMYESGKIKLYTNDLAKALSDNNVIIVREACWMLTEWEAKDKIGDIVKLVQHSDENVKAQALSAIRILGNRQHLKLARPLLESENQRIADGAWRVFEKLASDQELLELKPSFKSKQQGSRSHSVAVYENRVSRQHIEEIVIPKLSSESEYEQACDVLAKIGKNKDFPHLLPLLRDNEKAWGAYHTGAKLIDEHNIPDILPLLKNPGWHVRRCACWLLRDHGKPENIPYIYPLIKDENSFVRYSAYDSIQQIAQRSFGKPVLFKYSTKRFLINSWFYNKFCKIKSRS